MKKQRRVQRPNSNVIPQSLQLLATFKRKPPIINQISVSELEEQNNSDSNWVTPFFFVFPPNSCLTYRIMFSGAIVKNELYFGYHKD